MPAYILENEIQPYVWGSHEAIQNLLGIDTGSPMAEVWMGAHPNAPSMVKLENEDLSLEALIDREPTSVLGRAVADRFSNRLPFLFKLLAAEKCLSIQAHPNREQAQQGFARENALGIGLKADNRSYRDQNHKPEVLCALTTFWGLNGFRPLGDIIELLTLANLSSIANEVARFQEQPSQEGLRTFFSTILSLDETRRDALVQDLLQAAEGLQHQRDEFQWILRINKDYPNDPGILCVLLLNLVELEPGQAMYCEAGDLHAYLYGFGVELMANSDNVLRGGLTSKYIDQSELLKVLTFKCGQPNLVKPEPVTPSESRYPIPIDEFELCRIQVDSNRVWQSADERGPEIFVCVEGTMTLTLDGDQMHLATGHSVVIPSSADTYQLSGNGTGFKAGVPI